MRKAARRWTKIRHGIEFRTAVFVQKIMIRLPLWLVLGLASVLGWFIYHAIPIRRAVVLANLKRAFPEKSGTERRRIAARAYRHFAKMVFEFIRFPVLSDEDVRAAVQIEGKEHLDEAIRNGKGAILVAGHFDNLELFGAGLVKTGYPFAFLIGKQRNKRVDVLMNQMHALMGIQMIARGIALRGVFKALRNNTIVCIMSDQDAKRQGVFVDFFGHPASTHQGAAVFVLRTRAPLLFGSTVRLPKGRHKIVIERVPYEHLDGVTPENILAVTQAHTRFLENAIRKAPDHWLWMHRRWKTKPRKSEPGQPDAAQLSTNTVGT